MRLILRYTRRRNANFRLVAHVEDVFVNRIWKNMSMLAVLPVRIVRSSKKLPLLA